MEFSRLPRGRQLSSASPSSSSPPPPPPSRSSSPGNWPYVVISMRGLSSAGAPPPVGQGPAGRVVAGRGAIVPGVVADGDGDGGAALHEAVVLGGCQAGAPQGQGEAHVGGVAVGVWGGGRDRAGRSGHLHLADAFIQSALQEIQYS